MRSTEAVVSSHNVKERQKKMDRIEGEEEKRRMKVSNYLKGDQVETLLNLNL